MTPERWKRTEELYHAARARPPGERAAFLADACPYDDALRREVASLLSERVRRGFLAEPPVVDGGDMPPDLARAFMTGRVARRVSPAGAPRRGRHGRGVPRARHEARPRRRDQGPAAGVHERPRSARALRARGADARRAEPSQHLRHLRPRGSRRRPVPDSRTGGGRDARADSSPTRRVATRQRRAADSAKRWPSRGRSPRRSRSRTKRGSSTAT